MSDKVWIINEPRKESPNQSQGLQKAAAPALSRYHQTNPASAFSLSLLIWGAGQIYNGQRVLGFLFILMMANFYAILPLTILYWKLISSSLASVYITSFQIFAGWGVLYFTGLILWAFNAIHAYHKSIQTRTDSFKGIDSRLLPPLCSFFIPGWGQFLNGQPKKGGCLLLFAAAGHFVLSTFLLILFLWPVLDSEMDRFLLEKALAIAVALSPLIFLVWVFGIYDALRISLDPVKKEPLRKRIRYAINRNRIKGWKNAVVSRVKPIFMLGLFLMLSLILSHNYFPQRDYISMLKSLEGQLSNQKMVFIPGLIDQFIHKVLPEASRHHNP